MILNHLDLYVPDVSATSAFFEEHFGEGQQVDPPRTMRGRYLFYCLAPGNILIEVSASSDEE